MHQIHLTHLLRLHGLLERLRLDLNFLLRRQLHLLKTSVGFLEELRLHFNDEDLRFSRYPHNLVEEPTFLAMILNGTLLLNVSLLIVKSVFCYCR